MGKDKRSGELSKRYFEVDEKITVQDTQLNEWGHETQVVTMGIRWKKMLKGCRVTDVLKWKPQGEILRERPILKWEMYIGQAIADKDLKEGNCNLR